MSNLKMTEPAIVFYVFDNRNKIVDIVTLKDESLSEPLNQSSSELERGKYVKKFSSVFKVDGYCLSEFMQVLNASEFYYRLVVNNFLNCFKNLAEDGEINVKFRLVKPKVEVMDQKWNDRMCYLLVERQELEQAMSWLSTLGGAFSALGDSFENCAKVAGKISLQQFKIAYRLGEPPLVARCKLYMALSLIQLGKFGIAKCLVQDQYQLAKAWNDFRLQNMCKGIWSKLQYVYKLRKINKNKMLRL